MKQLLPPIFFFGLLLAACKPGAEKDPSYQFEKGFGDSKEHPVGVPFSWPAGIRLLDKPNSTEDCFEDSKKKNRFHGHGGNVQICLNLYNETDAPIKVQLPPGFMLVAKSLRVQNGFIVTWVTIEVPPREQYFATLYMICANTDRSSPYNDEIEEQAVITDHPALRELSKLLENKKCNFEDYGGKYLDPDAVAASDLPMLAAKNLIYGKPITEDVKARILALPER
ncbi:MAG: hypothetical protein BGO21_29900 [Dyadobacter sp. 50-39]|uniref:hypothetical protein n=1 Tax=Dyadobacter sp. 50-39 TaxID=1895756 RepID=UPI00096315F6|nr:hypothetical protein [Dyadobacter sp. 50-39]OJV15221.1 MAG: hypothetical protein BGO21_29900 [Dyadobacter sp. 50-39]